MTKESMTAIETTIKTDKTKKQYIDKQKEKNAEYWENFNIVRYVDGYCQKVNIDKLVIEYKKHIVNSNYVLKDSAILDKKYDYIYSRYIKLCLVVRKYGMNIDTSTFINGFSEIIFKPGDDFAINNFPHCSIPQDDGCYMIVDHMCMSLNNKIISSVMSTSPKKSDSEDNISELVDHCITTVGVMWDNWTENQKECNSLMTLFIRDYKYMYLHELFQILDNGLILKGELINTFKELFSIDDVFVHTNKIVSLGVLGLSTIFKIISAFLDIENIKTECLNKKHLTQS